MPKAGPDREVSNERILLEFLLTSDPALFASEVAENLPITRQRVSDILDEMEREEGYVTSKKASGRRLWWLTPAGKDFASNAAREKLS